jgi:hypothetical protein
MKVYARSGEETFDDIQITETSICRAKPTAAFSIAPKWIYVMDLGVFENTRPSLGLWGRHTISGRPRGPSLAAVSALSLCVEET